MRQQKPLSSQFEDDLGRLVDQYLSEGIDIAALKNVLRDEADHDHEERRRELVERAEGHFWMEIPEPPGQS
jgi:hypothetical protein